MKRREVLRPLDVTSALLFPLWTYEEGEADLTVMRGEARKHRHQYDFYEHHPTVTTTSTPSTTPSPPPTVVIVTLTV